MRLRNLVCKRVTNYRALLRKMTYKDKAFYGSSRWRMRMPHVAGLFRQVSRECMCVCARAQIPRLPENHASLSQDKCIRVFEEPGCYLYLCVCERERERKRETVRVHAYL